MFFLFFFYLSVFFVFWTFYFEDVEANLYLITKFFTKPVAHFT